MRLPKNASSVVEKTSRNKQIASTEPEKNYPNPEEPVREQSNFGKNFFTQFEELGDFGFGARL